MSLALKIYYRDKEIINQKAASLLQAMGHVRQVSPAQAVLPPPCMLCIVLAGKDKASVQTMLVR